jgi:CRP-like cAMP-binding protein
MQESVKAQLRAIPIYARLSKEAIGMLAAVAKTRLLQHGEVLFDPGDPGEHFHMIVRGRIKICRKTPSGKELIMALLGPGDPVGAAAVYLERPFPARAEALEDTICLSMPRDSFYALLDESPSMVRGVLLGMTLRLVELTGRLNQLAGTRVEPRFARLFLKLADRMGRETDAGIFIPMKLSRQELADLTGTTIETAIRTMSKWGREGVVETRDDGFQVTDLSSLQAIAEA